MSKRPYMKFYVGDWLSSQKVSLMTPEQRGAYIQLLCHAWLSEDGSLPSNHDDLATLSGLFRRWRINSQKLLACFQLRNGRLYNERLSQELREMKDKSNSAASSAQARWNANAMRTHSDGNATQTQTQTQIQKIQPPSSSTMTGLLHFDAFWSQYPRKVGKGTAKKAWRAKKLDADSNRILEGLARCKDSEQWRKEGGQFVPHPTTWINREGWDDVPDTSKPQNGHKSNGSISAYGSSFACNQCHDEGAVKSGGRWIRCVCRSGIMLEQSVLDKANTLKQTP